MKILFFSQKNGDVHYYGGGLFLVIFISIGAFIFANLVVAVVVTNLESAVKDVREEEQIQAKQLALRVGKSHFNLNPYLYKDFLEPGNY